MNNSLTIKKKIIITPFPVGVQIRAYNLKTLQLKEPSNKIINVY